MARCPRGFGVVIPGTANVCSVITERVTQAKYEPFINIHSCTWRAVTLAYGGEGGKEEDREERRAGTYLMTGVWRL